jgi:DNA-binding PadR family transcriptional regulator
VAGRFQERAQAELKRGVLQIAVLGLLRRSTYGYELLKVLQGAGIPTEEGTLYPVLRRLEKEGLLAAEWNTDGSRPRKYYRTTDRGTTVLDALVADWSGVTQALERVLDAPQGEGAGESHADDLGQQGAS